MDAASGIGVQLRRAAEIISGVCQNGLTAVENLLTLKMWRLGTRFQIFRWSSR
jgi:hypothetical protein